MPRGGPQRPRASPAAGAIPLRVPRHGDAPGCVGGAAGGCPRSTLSGSTGPLCWPGRPAPRPPSNWPCATPTESPGWSCSRRMHPDRSTTPTASRNGWRGACGPLAQSCGQSHVCPRASLHSWAYRQTCPSAATIAAGSRKSSTRSSPSRGPPRRRRATAQTPRRPRCGVGEWHSHEAGSGVPRRTSDCRSIVRSASPHQREVHRCWQSSSTASSVWARPRSWP